MRDEGESVEIMGRKVEEGLRVIQVGIWEGILCDPLRQVGVSGFKRVLAWLLCKSRIGGVTYVPLTCSIWEDKPSKLPYQWMGMKSGLQDP